MEITARNEFAADPVTVYAMVTNEAFLREVAAASDATSTEVTVSTDATRTVRELPTPSAARTFLGSTMRVHEDLAWGAPGPDGSRTGRLDVSVPGLPVTMNGTVTLQPGGSGSVLDYRADLVVNVPFIGKKMEQAAAPQLLAAIRTQQDVGGRWLATHA